MQSRRLRLGDVVDDYCPRERRLSNHVIVAMVDDTIKQTRCSTCDFEHPYKDGKLPARRLKKAAAPDLYTQVLEHVIEGTAEPAAPPPRGVLRANGAAGDDDAAPSEDTEARVAHASEAADPAPEREREPADEGPVHRTLIRAQLPRQEGEVPVRPIPTFTIREAAAAPKFRRFRPKRGGRPFGDGFGNQGGGFKNPQFGAQPGRGHGPGQKPGGGPNRGDQQPRAAGGPSGRRNNNTGRGNKGPR